MVSLSVDFPYIKEFQPVVASLPQYVWELRSTLAKDHDSIILLEAPSSVVQKSWMSTWTNNSFVIMADALSTLITRSLPQFYPVLLRRHFSDGMPVIRFWAQKTLRLFHSLSSIHMPGHPHVRLRLWT